MQFKHLSKIIQIPQDRVREALNDLLTLAASSNLPKLM